MSKFAMLTLGAMLAMQSSVSAAESPFEVRSIHFTGSAFQNEEFKYLELPPAKVEPGKKYPLVFFLHGAGERGVNNMEVLKAHFPSIMAEATQREKFPCFVVAPQCRPDKRWVETNWGDRQSQPMAEKPGEMMQMAIAILQKSLAELPVDPQRVYLTGLSMGGYGTWELAARHPDWFAAVAPICGGGDERQAARLKNVPLWAFHGDADNAVPVGRSRQMIEAIKAAGGAPRYTEMPGVGHDSWTPAYRDPNGLLPWMFEQKKATELRRPRSTGRDSALP